jgi:hypothetical protein
MVQRLEAIPHKKISITCAGCQHTVVHEVANLLLFVDGETTAHEIRNRASCPKCLEVGNNTYKVL